MGISEGIAILVAVLSFTNLARKKRLVQARLYGGGDQTHSYPKGCGTPPPSAPLFYNRDPMLQPSS